MNRKIIRLIPALDCIDLEKAESVVRSVHEHDGVYGFKLGFALGLTYGLKKAVECIRKYSSKPIIYDHQKGATDIPDTGALFAETLKNAGIDEAIIFPQAGPGTMDKWIAALREKHLKVIVGGIMTHGSYLVSEGGFLADDGITKIYSESLRAGVTSFVVPLTKAELVEKIIAKLPFTEDCEFYSPGYGRQGGDPALFKSVRRHYLIVGRSLLESPDPERWIRDTYGVLERSL